MVVLPYYLHSYKAFGKMVILGEFLAVSAVLMCMLFVFVDMGQPWRDFIEIFIFVGILSLAIVYAYRKGVFRWE